MLPRTIREWFGIKAKIYNTNCQKNCRFCNGNVKKKIIYAINQLNFYVNYQCLFINHKIIHKDHNILLLMKWGRVENIFKFLQSDFGLVDFNFRLKPSSNSKVWN